MKRTSMDGYMAAMNGDLPRLKDLLGEQLDTRFLLEQTALHIACERNHQDMAAWLLNLGADSRLVDYRKNTPLHLAAGVGAAKIVAMLMARGAEANAKNAVHETPLHRVCGGGGRASGQDRVAIVTALVDAGSDIDAQDSAGRTPLWFAASPHMGQSAEVSVARLSVIKLLLAKGADRTIRANGQLGQPLDASRGQKPGQEWLDAMQILQG